MKSEYSLFLATATKDLEVSVIKKDDGLITGRKEITGIKSNLTLELLTSLIEDACSFFDIKLKDVESFYTLLGPGSNTGLRLALTVIMTVYALNPNIRMYGINTLKVYLSKREDIAVLSDRKRNIYVGHYENNEFITEIIRREEISDHALFRGRKVVIEKADCNSLSLFENHEKEEIVVVNKMVERRDGFEDYSSREESFLPIYQFQI